MKLVIIIAFWATLVGIMVFCTKDPSRADSLEKWTTLAESTLIHGSRISKVMFVDRNNGIAVAPGFIARSGDGGKRWEQSHSGERNSYYSFAFKDRENGIAVGSVANQVPLALSTKDSGKSWQTLDLDLSLLHKSKLKITSFLDACFDTSGVGWLAGNGGVISVSVDGGKLRILSAHFVEGTLYSVACAADGQIWAAGQNMVLHKTSSVGWQPKSFDSNFYFGSIKSIGNDLWLLGSVQTPAKSGNSGILLRSKDFGTSWETKTPITERLAFDLFQTGEFLWLVGEGGQIHSSRNNGESWSVSQAPTSSDLLSVYFLDSQTGWIAGERGTVLAYTP